MLLTPREHVYLLLPLKCFNFVANQIKLPFHSIFFIASHKKVLKQAIGKEVQRDKISKYLSSYCL